LANCKYCGKPAGLLSQEHPDCESRYENGKGQLVAAVSQACSSSEPLDLLSSRLDEIARRSFVSDSEKHGLLIEAWSSAVDRSLEDGILDKAEEQRLVELQERLCLSQSELLEAGAYLKVVKAAIIRDLLSGVIPKQASFEGNIPVNLQGGEQIIWLFPKTEYLEDKTRRTYVGGSQGVSLRIMKGLYYRVGGFKGHAIERTERVHVDTGWFVVTTKNVYFAGPAKSFRLPYRKIVSFQPFSDGVGIMRDTTNAKAQIFVTGDGWFTYNLATNLARLEAAE